MSEQASWKLSASLEALQLRAKLYSLIRDFFAKRSVLEVETPIMSAAANTEPNIESFCTEFSGPKTAGVVQRWLRTSPEFALKRLLADGVGDCYELGKVFRNAEASNKHNPEFSMLEWYRLGFNHLRLMQETSELLVAAMGLVKREMKVRALSYQELFQEFVDINPHTATDIELRAALVGHGDFPQNLDRDDLLNLVLMLCIEPKFGDDEICCIFNFPSSQAALARIASDGEIQTAQRFEIYVCGLEVANGYHELAEPLEQLSRFQNDIERRREKGKIVPPHDQHLIDALENGLPDCAGVALGIERLLMAMLGTRKIADVVSFTFERA